MFRKSPELRRMVDAWKIRQEHLNAALFPLVGIPESARSRKYPPAPVPENDPLIDSTEE